VGVIPEMAVDGETGILVDPGNADAITKASLKILKGAKLRVNMGNTGRKRVEDLFDQKRTIRETIELY
jgi:glycosyltransferase involved in cell wall biosynthesis